MSEFDRTQPSQRTNSGEIVSGLPSSASLIAGRYRILSMLGEGGMGAVYKVEQIYLKREMALKTLISNTPTEVLWRRFQKEAKAASSLEHPNLIKVLDFGLLEESQQPFLVMELAPGEPLSSIIKRQGPLSIDLALRIFIEVCNGLDYAHANGVIHRDIKPSNIMVANISDPANVQVKIIDFGIAKRELDIESSESMALTKTGEIFGTPYYMSPEQALGQTVDSRTDMYSLGCVLFETLTGLPPFTGENALATIMHHQNTNPPTLKEATMGGNFPNDLERVIQKLLAKKQPNRYSKLFDVATDLELIRSNKPIQLGYSTTEENVSVADDKGRKSFSRAVVGTVLALGLTIGFALGQIIHGSQNTVPDKLKERPPIEGLALIAPPPAVPKLSTETTPISVLLPDSKWRLYNFGDIDYGWIRWVKGEERRIKKGELEKEGDMAATGQVLMNGPFILDCSLVLEQNPVYFKRFRHDDLADVLIKHDCPAFSSTDLKNLDHLDKLYRLIILARNSIDSSAIPTFDKLSRLIELRLRCGPKLDDATIAKIQKLPLLEVLELQNLKTVDAVLEKLANSNTLTILNLVNCGVSGNAKKIGAIHSIQNLNLTDNPITDDDLNFLIELPKLQELNISGCSKLTPKCLKLLATLPLKVLRITPFKTGQADQIRGRLPNIKEIKFQSASASGSITREEADDFTR